MILIDAHVHRHRCFPAAQFLDAAGSNIAATAQCAGLPASTPGMLLFTHSATDDAFGGLRAGAVGRWLVSATQEDVSMCVRPDRGPPLILVAGRQIVTAEGLEVLALGAGGPFADNQPVETTIDGITDQHGVPVLPWGFGKWTRRRRAIVRRLAADHTRFPLLFLGDTASRPGIAPRPRLLGQAERLRRAVLPGTDPLPLSGEVGKVGRLAFKVDRTLNTDTPFADLKDWLMRCDTTPPIIGSYERADVFVRRQVEIQLRKRL